MKRSIKTFFIIAFFSFLLVMANPISADTPPPPPGGGHGTAGNMPPGGGVPIGEGMLLLVALAAGYGLERIINVRRKLRDQDELEHQSDSATE